DLRDRVAAHVSLVIRYVLISAAEHHRLKDDAVDPLYVFAHKANDVTDCVVVDPVHNTHLQCGLHAGCGDVFKSAMLHLHVIPNAAVPVLFFRCPIELQIDTMQACPSRAKREGVVLRKADSIRCNVDTVETHGLCVPDRVKEHWGESCLAAREQD